MTIMKSSCNELEQEPSETTRLYEIVRKDEGFDSLDSLDGIEAHRNVESCKSRKVCVCALVLIVALIACLITTMGFIAARGNMFKGPWLVTQADGQTLVDISKEANRDQGKNQAKNQSKNKAPDGGKGINPSKVDGASRKESRQE
eukprot:g73935.t1